MPLRRHRFNFLKKKFTKSHCVGFLSKTNRHFFEFKRTAYTVPIFDIVKTIWNEILKKNELNVLNI
jgi:hypothetical protein